MTVIGESALSGCESLTSLTLPDSVTALRREALQGMTGLKTLTLGAGLQTIHSTALNGCSSLTAILVSDDNSAYTGVDGILYSSDLSILFRYPQARPDASFTVPSQVVQIGASAFADTRFLKQVAFPDNLLFLEEGSFRNASLTTADLSGSTLLESLPASVFDSCDYLSSVLLPSSLVSIGENAFHACRALPELNIPDTVNLVGANAFWPQTVLICGADSKAHQYAQAEDLPFRIRGEIRIAAESVSLSKDSLTLLKGTGYTLTAFTEPADTTDLLLWSSSDPKILRVDDGFIRPLEAGSTEILVTVGDAQVQIPVEVIDGAPFSIETASSAVFAGQTVELTFRELTDNVAVPSVVWVCDDSSGIITGNILGARGNGIGNVSAYGPDGSVQSKPFAFLDPAQAMTVLPNVQVIESEAFQGLTAASCVIFMNGSTASIGENAFADCPNLSFVYLPDSITQIDSSAFANCPSVTFICHEESEAAAYAAAHEIPVFLLP